MRRKPLDVQSLLAVVLVSIGAATVNPSEAMAQAPKTETAPAAKAAVIVLQKKATGSRFFVVWTRHRRASAGGTPRVATSMSAPEAHTLHRQVKRSPPSRR